MFFHVLSSTSLPFFFPTCFNYSSSSSCFFYITCSLLPSHFYCIPPHPPSPSLVLSKLSFFCHYHLSPFFCFINLFSLSPLLFSAPMFSPVFFCCYSPAFAFRTSHHPFLSSHFSHLSCIISLPLVSISSFSLSSL